LMEHISMQKSLGYGRQTWRWKSTMFISWYVDDRRWLSH
jgi:hypothetical protein